MDFFDRETGLKISDLLLVFLVVIHVKRRPGDAPAILSAQLGELTETLILFSRMRIPAMNRFNPLFCNLRSSFSQLFSLPLNPVVDSLFENAQRQCAVPKNLVVKPAQVKRGAQCFAGFGPQFLQL